MGSGGLELKKVNEDENTQFFLKASEKPIAIIDLQGKINKVNHHFVKVFGIKERSNVEQIIATQSLETWRAVLQQVIQTKKITCEILMNFGYVSMHSVRTSLDFDEKTQTIVLSAILPLKLTTKTQFSWRKMFRRSEDLVFVSDGAGEIHDVNELTMDFFDLTPEEFMAYKMDDVFALFSKESMNITKFKQEILETGYAETLQQYIHKSAHIRYYKISVIKDFSTNLLLIKIKDQTKKVILQQQEEQKESLLEVGQLAASVAHEIRNPITTLKGFTQLLKVKANEETLKYLSVIEDEIQRMELILSEMLNLSKPTVVKKEEISLNNLLMNIIRVIGPKATLENINITQETELSDETFILGEEGRLKQVFLNLFKNSLASMEAGGTLSIYVQECEDNLVNVIIKDTGKGIEEQSLNQIFMPYFTTRLDGTGLGLPFVLKTVEEHDGTISVSSEVDKGTSFILTFPVVKQSTVVYAEMIKAVPVN